MIAFYWSNATMAFLRFMCIYSACKLNPNDQVRLYRKRGPTSSANDPEVAAEFDYIPFLSRLPNLEVVWIEDVLPGLRMAEPVTADIVKYYNLALYGGTSSDMDILYFKPLPPVTHDIEYVGFPNVLPVGFFQGRPCKFWQDLYLTARGGGMGSGLQSCGVSLFHCGLRTIFLAGSESWYEFPSSIVYPFVPENYDFAIAGNIFFMQHTPLKEFPPDCIGFHYWGGDYISRTFLPKVHHKNYMEFANTMSLIISAVLAPSFDFNLE